MAATTQPVPRGENAAAAADRRRWRVAQVTSERGFSGGEVQVFLLVDGLRELGHECAVYCPPGSRAEEEARRRDLAVFTIPQRGDVDLLAARRLARGFVAARVDVVHLNTGRAAWLGGMAAWWAGIPALVTRRMDRPVKRNWRTRLVYGRFARRAAAISPAVAECLAAGGVPRERIGVIPEAVDFRRIAPLRGRDAVRAAEGATTGGVVLLAMAALVRRKGLDVLLDAVAALAGNGMRPAVWLAGDGPERGALAAQAERLGLGAQVRFLGYRRDVGDLLAACDILVLPSRREGLGNAALEAMGAGRPVVASAVGGLAEAVIDGRTGLLVPPEDTAALGAALERLLRDEGLRGRLGAAGPSRIGEGFLPEQMVAAYERLYGEIIAGG